MAALATTSCHCSIAARRGLWESGLSQVMCKTEQARTTERQLIQKERQNKTRTSEKATPRDTAGNSRERGWATTDNWAARGCRRRTAQLRLGSAARASLDTAARPNNASRIIANCMTRAKGAMWHGARRNHKRRARRIVARGNAPRRRGRQVKERLGDGNRPSHEALPARNRENSLLIGSEA